MHWSFIQINLNVKRMFFVPEKRPLRSQNCCWEVADVKDPWDNSCYILNLLSLLANPESRSCCGQKESPPPRA